MCLLTEIMYNKGRKFEIAQNPQLSKIEQIRQNLYDAHRKLYKRYGRTAKPTEEVTNARLASVSIVEWVIFSAHKTKRTLSVELFDSCTIQNYVLTDYVLTESVKYVSQYDSILGRRVLCL